MVVAPDRRIGALLGPQGSTITDLRNLLDLIFLPVSNINAQLVELVLPLMLPTSESNPGPTGWPGLREILLSIDSKLAGGVTPGDSLANIERYLSYLAYHMGATFAQGAQQPGGVLVPPRYLDLLSEVSAALSTGSNDTAIARLGAIDLSNASILAAIGAISSDPSGQTARQLLEAIRACSCNDGGGEVQPLNDPPADTCFQFQFGPFRATELILLDNTPQWGSNGNDHYALYFGDPETPTGGLVAQDNDTSATVPFAAYWPQTGDAEVCIAWNLTGNTFPVTLTRRAMGSGDFFNTTGNGTNITVAQVEGSSNTTFNAGIRFCYILEVPTGTPPPNLNFWLSFNPGPS